MSRRYLVTGGLGFLGSAIARSLADAGHVVRIFDDCSRGSEERLGPAAAHVEITRGDIRDSQAVAAAAEGIDSVLHFAYINGTRFFYERPGEVLDVGVRGMLNVLAACREHDVPELFVASSSEVYHEPAVLPTPENVPLVIPDPANPRFSYSGGKILCELMALQAAPHLDRVVIFRPHNVYGPQMGWEHVIPEFVIRMRDLARHVVGRIEFPIQGTGAETRAFVYVDDFAAAFLVLLQHAEHRGIYNIGTDQETSIADVAREVARYFDREVDIIPGDLRRGSTSRRCPDVSRLRALGFTPRVRLEEGIPLTARWYDANAGRRPAVQKGAP